MTTGAFASMLLLVSSASCLRSTEFTCSTSAQCGAGTCEPSGFCSVADGAGGATGQDCVAVKSNVAKFLDETCSISRVAVCECVP